MTKYRLFLFDADDTLLDFRESEKVALRETFHRFGIAERYDELYPTYRAVSGVLWGKLEEGRLTQDFLKIERFRTTFEKHGVDLEPEKVNDDYMERLTQTIRVIPGAVELCQELRMYGKIGIVTNGIQEVQERRIANSPLASHLDFVAISEACGYSKPDVRFFEYAMSLAGPYPKHEILMVGDRGEADVRGALNFGVDACYFNPLKRPLALDLKPKFEIERLSDLMPSILRGF